MYNWKWFHYSSLMQSIIIEIQDNMKTLSNNHDYELKEIKFIYILVFSWCAVMDWAQGKPAAIGITVTSPLIPHPLHHYSCWDKSESWWYCSLKQWKLAVITPKCAELGGLGVFASNGGDFL